MKKKKKTAATRSRRTSRSRPAGAPRGALALEAVACLFFFKQKTAYEITYGDWSSDVCSSDLRSNGRVNLRERRSRIWTTRSSRRSEERRVGKECRRLCRSRWSPCH